VNASGEGRDKDNKNGHGPERGVAESRSDDDESDGEADAGGRQEGGGDGRNGAGDGAGASGDREEATGSREKGGDEDDEACEDVVGEVAGRCFPSQKSVSFSCSQKSVSFCLGA